MESEMFSTVVAIGSEQFMYVDINWNTPIALVRSLYIFYGILLITRFDWYFVQYTCVVCFVRRHVSERKPIPSLQFCEWRRRMTTFPNFSNADTVSFTTNIGPYAFRPRFPTFFHSQHSKYILKFHRKTLFLCIVYFYFILHFITSVFLS